MMNKILIAMTLGAVFVASTASAQPYIGAMGGSAATDTQHTSTKVFAGFQFIPNLGIEAAYTDFGGYRSASANAISLAVVGTLPLGDTWDLFARWGSTQNQTNNAGAASHTDMLTGFGVAYNASRNVSIRVETENYGKLPTDPDGTSTTASNWGVSVKFLF
jgi:hypothetical protein